MEREKMLFKQEEEALIKQIDDLKFQMTIVDKCHKRCEDYLREEIARLNECLQQEEAKRQDLTHQAISTAMLPLMMQIENIPATLEAQSAAWERVDKLLDRLALIALALAQEKEKTANDHLMELSARVASLEAANKQEKAQLGAEVESDSPKLEKLQDIDDNSTIAHLESSKQSLSHELTHLKMDKDLEIPTHAS
ncbi:hypothetical protein BsWGS_06433 [Bradybaena similaris]